jgi:hypothetical protein
LICRSVCKDRRFWEIKKHVYLIDFFRILYSIFFNHLQLLIFLWQSAFWFSSAKIKFYFNPLIHIWPLLISNFRFQSIQFNFRETLFLRAINLFSISFGRSWKHF